MPPVIDRRGLFASLGGLPLGLAVRAGAADVPVELTIDASRPLGAIKPLHGVNGGPLAVGGTLDLSARWKELSPPLARLHDCRWPNPDVVDLSAVFPDPTADPESPASYDFARTDEYVKAVLDTGAGVVYRLGESIEHVKAKRRVRPPRDPARWAAACVGVARHYTDGWAGGFRYPVRYWEVWNEPDNRPAMWTGTDAEFFRLYSLAAKAVKARFPRLLVGGPGLGNTGRLDGDALTPPVFLTAFLDHCRRDGAPLDFFTWHCYTNDPQDLVRRGAGVRRLLDAAGFEKAESHLNEWNYLPDNDWAPMLSPDAVARKRWHDRAGGAEGAAFAASAMLLLQDAPVNVANYFTADAQPIGLFDWHGVPRTVFHGLRAFKLLADAGNRLAVRGRVSEGLAVGAAVNRERTEVIMLVSRYAGPTGSLRFAVKNLPWPGATRVERSSVDGAREPGPVSEGVLPADGRVELDVPPSSVQVVRLRRAP